MSLSKARSLSSLFLAVMAMGTIFFAYQLKDLKFDYSFESFFPQGNPELAYYEKVNESFGEQNNFLFLSIENLDFSSLESIQGLRSLEQHLESAKGVTSVQSLFDKRIIQITPFGINRVIQFAEGRIIEIDELKKTDYWGQYIGKDGSSMLMVVLHEPFESKKAGDNFYLNINQEIEKLGFSAYQLSGKTQMQYDFTQKLESQLSKLLIGGLVVVLTLLILINQKLKGIFYPLVIILTSVVWTLGIMVIMGKQVDVLIVMLPVILIILSVSDVVHLSNKYDHFISSGLSNLEAIKASFRSVGKATFLTSTTTSIGFLSLYFLPITPIKDFGLFASLGVMIAFAHTFLLIPSLLIFYPGKVSNENTQVQRGLNKVLLFLISSHNSSRGLKIGLTITFLLCLGIFSIRQNTGLIVGLQKNEPMLEKVAYFDQYFNGYRPLEVAFETNDLFELSTLQKLQELEQSVLDIFQAKSIESPLTLIKQINSAYYGGAPSRLALPELKDLEKVKRTYYSRRLANERSLFDNGQNFFRMIATTQDVGSEISIELTKQFQHKLSGLNTPDFNAQITGASYLIDTTDHYVIQALVKGLVFAIFSVGLITLLLYKSVRLALIVIATNLLPIMVLFGLMGYLNIDLNISTAIIFTVAFGIAVDDSIHFMTSYMQAKKKGAGSFEAIESTYRSTSKSILLTSIIIGAGFCVLLISGFSAVYYLGLFTSLMCLLALWYDLKLLPWLLSKFV